MTLERVQMLLEPRQRRRLAEIARQQGKSVAEVTRHAIDLGLEKISVSEQRQRVLAALETARSLRETLPRLEIDAVADLNTLRDARDEHPASGR